MRALLAVTAATLIALAVAIGCGADTGEDVPPATPADVPPGFFGVVPQSLLTEADLDRMQEGGVGTIRLVIPWGTLDPSPEPDEGDFSTIDPVLLIAAEHGIRVLPTVYGTPDWIAEDLDGESCKRGCAPFAPRSEKAIAVWKEFIGQLVDRFGPGGKLWEQNPAVDPQPVRSWQIWNEQNSPTFYQPEVDPVAYANLLEAASDAITERDPGAEVILGGMFGTPFKGEPPALSAADFLRQLYALDGARETFDSVAAHPYAARQGKIELQVELLHDEIVRADDDARLWITEVGASSDEGANPLERGPEGQAEQLRSAFEFFIAERQAMDIEGVTWYSWRDVTDPNQCDWCPGSGLFEEAELVPKPAWDEFVAFTGGS